jgi:hypothetical protein
MGCVRSTSVAPQPPAAIRLELARNIKRITGTPMDHCDMCGCYAVNITFICVCNILSCGHCEPWFTRNDRCLSCAHDSRICRGIPEAESYIEYVRVTKIANTILASRAQTVNVLV